MSSTGNKRARKISKQESALHESVFGKSISVATGTAPKTKSVGSQNAARSESSDDDDGDEDIHVGIKLDRGGKGAASKRAKGNINAAWSDDDDEDLEVDLQNRDRLKKLQKPDAEGKMHTKDSKVSGTQLSSLLQERFQTQQLDWAAVQDVEEGTGAGDGKEFLRQSGKLLAGGPDSSAPLAEGRLDIQRLIDANSADASKTTITSVKFHSGGSLLLAGGADRCLRFFNVDGERNEKVLSVRFNDMPISEACFLGNTSEVVIGGRKPYFYSYDSESGKTSKVPGLMGKNLKSYENLLVSPKGTRIAFLGASGYIHLVCGKQKTWQCDVKMNTAARSAVFVDEHTLISSGLDADIYKWDLRMHGRCLSRFKNEDGTCVSSLAMCPSATPSSSFLAVGSESGAMTLYNGNIPAGTEAPAVVRTAMNLTTKISGLAFHPSSQIMAFSSFESNDQLRMLHLGSRTIFSNWPTAETPLRKVQCMAFSPGGAYFAVGNDRGKVLLYRLNHFNNY